MGSEADSRTRSAAKSLSWRIFATLTTFIIGYLIQGNIATALKVTGPDFVFKYVTFYAHERLWQFDFLRSLSWKRGVKLLSWKLVAVSITMAITVIVNNGDWTMALKLGPIDSAVKTLTLALHEAVWERISFGRPSTKVSRD